MAQSHETQTPEYLNTSPEQIDAAFNAAHRYVYTLSSNPAFQASCLEQGIDPYDDMETPRYWQNVASYAYEDTLSRRETGEDPLLLDATALIASTPTYLFEQAALDRKSHGSGAERRHSKEVVSYFNGMVRDFASSFPETRASKLTTALLHIANKAIENKNLRQTSGQQLHATIRGAQHELAFSQILTAAGKQFRPANLQEDLRGIDYAVTSEDGGEMYIDVKASLSEIEARGSAKAFARKPDGKIVMYSLTRDSEFQDKFFTDQSVAVAKADVLNQLLSQAQAA